MRIEPLGESALLVRDLPCPPHLYAHSLNQRRPDGLIEAVPSYATVGLFIDPDRFSVESLCSVTWELPQSEPTEHLIPVVYDGPDILEACGRLGISTEEFVARHAGRTYACAAVGFRPGFAYLGDLDPSLARLPRRGVPRTHVPSGSVAIAGAQTAVYPQAGPGGWWLVGRCPLILVGEGNDYFPIAAGDRVRFQPISPEEFVALEGRRL